MRPILARCKSQPNWMPKKPTLILMISARLSLGFTPVKAEDISNRCLIRRGLKVGIICKKYTFCIQKKMIPINRDHLLAFQSNHLFAYTQFLHTYFSAPGVSYFEHINSFADTFQ